LFGVKNIQSKKYFIQKKLASKLGKCG